jgi:MmeI, DNA-methyltransferase domain
MINRRELLLDLRQQIGRMGHDLLGRVPSSLQDEYARAVTFGRTTANWTAWRDEQVAQTAVAWVLASVFVRFAEDNGLLGGSRHFADDPNRNDAGWLLSRLDGLAQTPAGELVFRQLLRRGQTMPMSDQTARDLAALWNRRDSGGAVHDFTDSSLDTSFLADLYQDLDESARKTYALLQTPPFVVDLVLDLTLDRAVEEFELHTIRLLDPVCGSGQFLLSAFERLCRSWRLYDPGLSPEQRAQRALNAIHGVDINPSAVAIARFRLLIAAMRAAGLKSFEEVSDLGLVLHLAAGDSLLQPGNLIC